MGLLIKFIGLLVRKVGGAMLAGLLVWAGAVVWLQSEDHGDFAARQKARWGVLDGKLKQTTASLRVIDQRKKTISDEIAAQQARSSQAARVIFSLHELDSVWDRYVGNPEQQKANTAQIERMETMKAQAQTQIDQLQNEFRRQVWQRSALELEQNNLQEQIDFARQHDSPLTYYPYQAWSRFRWAIISAVIVYVLAIWSWSWKTFWNSVPADRQPGAGIKRRRPPDS